MDFTNLKNYMDKTLSEYGVPGLDVIVNKDHKEVFRYCAGYSDIEAKRQVAGNELYTVFSMTKMLTCVSALQLLEKGHFLLNDSVSDYLPEFEKMKISEYDFDVEEAAKITTGQITDNVKRNSADGYAENPITIKNLFTMTAGLDYDLNAPYIKSAIADGKKSTRELVCAISQTVLGFEPGTRFRYSLCHDVLGVLVEVISGKRLGDYMEENIFKPLGMKNTFFGVPKDEKRLSKMMTRYAVREYALERLEQVCNYNLTDEYQSGGAGLVSCTEDYALFLDALACGGVGKNGNRILSENSVELMGTNHLSGKAADDFNKIRPGYGYGLGVRTHIRPDLSGSLSPVGEFGWDGAAGAFSMVDTKNKLSLTYFQEMHGWDLRMQKEMRNALYSCLD